MPDNPVTRGKFLRTLGTSVTEMALGTGVAVAAQVLVKAGRVVSSAPKGEAVALDDVPFFKSGPAEENRIALTFDDGPTPGVTESILDQLKQRNISATFFMIGERVAAAPELARRVLAEGHEIGNHTFTHPKLTTLTDQQVEAELHKTQETFSHELNHRPVWFRPPYGELRKNQGGIVQREGLGVVLWNADSRDWSRPGEAKIAENILAQTKAGSIILCHDLHLQTANAIGSILDSLLERRFAFVTISMLLRQHHLVD